MKFALLSLFSSIFGIGSAVPPTNNYENYEKGDYCNHDAIKHE